MLAAHVHPANLQDRDGALPLLKEARRLFPFIVRLFADGGYQGPATAAAVHALGAWRLAIVKRPDQAKGFVVLPKRWLVERSVAWPGRCRPRPYRLSGGLLSHAPVANETGHGSTRTAFFV